jgi:hypothetical protein
MLNQRIFLFLSSPSDERDDAVDDDEDELEGCRLRFSVSLSSTNSVKLIIIKIL